MSLRDYQREALDSIKSHYEQGIRRQLIVSPTGSGKTQIISHLPNVLGLKKGEKMIMFVHRNDLVGQSVKKLRKYNPSLMVDSEQASAWANKYADIIVASIQSISRKNRLSRWNPDAFRYIVLDEVHVVPGSKAYFDTLKYFNAVKGENGHDPTKFVAGFTATPDRPDGKGLDWLLDEVVYSIDIREMMQRGIMHMGDFLPYLCDIKAFSVKTKVDLSKVKNKGKDFDIEALEKAINNPYRNKIIIDSYLEHGEDKPAICFTVDIKHAKDIVAEFKTRGLDAAIVTGDTPPEERAILYKKLADREIHCLASAGVLNVGLDIPQATVALWARPTQSGLLYRQSVGRVLRPYPSPEEIVSGVSSNWTKDYCIVIDFVDSCSKHDLVTLPTLFGLSPSFINKGNKLLETLKAIDKAKEKKPTLDITKFENLDAVTAESDNVDLIKKSTKQFADISDMPWIQSSRDTYVLSLDNKMFSIVSDPMGYNVSSIDNGVKVSHGRHPSLMDAVESAESFIDKRDIIVKNGRLTTTVPTDAQLKFICQLNPHLQRIYPDVIDRYKHLRGMLNTKEEASSYIDKIIGKRGKKSAST